jgi:hypothetical protein
MTDMTIDQWADDDPRWLGAQGERVLCFVCGRAVDHTGGCLFCGIVGPDADPPCPASNALRAYYDAERLAAADLDRARSAARKITAEIDTMAKLAYDQACETAWRVYLDATNLSPTGL